MGVYYYGHIFYSLLINLDDLPSKIRRYNEEITTNNVDSLPVIGNKSKDKIKLILKTGTLPNLNKDSNLFFKELINIPGIGPSCAKKIINLGIKSIKELKNSNILNSKQKMGLKYHPIRRIPRKEIILFEKFLKDLKLNGQLNITGSYRRGKDTSGDIDILLDNSTTFNELIELLKKNNLILDILAKGKKKFMGYIKLTSNGLPCRIDILNVPLNEYAFGLLYFTESKNFNIMLRKKAIELGFKLNEKGLYSIKSKQKVNYSFKNENDIFQFLKVKYLLPINRI